MRFRGACPGIGGQVDVMEFDLDFVNRCFDANVVGDSVLYNAINRGKFVYHVIGDRWMVYVGPHWEIDYTGRSLAAVELVAEQYLRLIDDIELKISNSDDKVFVKNMWKRHGKVISRINRLRDDGGRKKVLSCARSNAEPLTVHPDELDTHPWLLPVKNGVVDLRSGELLPGDPTLFFTSCAPTEWPADGIDAEPTEFIRFLQEILDNDKQIFNFLHRVLGYSMTALNIERFFLILYGEHGQNGKGSLMEILYHVLGGLAVPIQSEMLVAQKFTKSASGPTPDIMAIKGKRLIWASETEEYQRFASGVVKKLSGGDPLIGRNPNDKDQTTFFPTHTLFLLTNNKPGAPAHDSAFWTRLHQIDFPLSFVSYQPKEEYERPADPNLIEKLKQERSSILAWLVRGCLEYQNQGLAPPDSVVEYAKKYRRQEDVIQDYIDDCCDVGEEYSESLKALWHKFKLWRDDQGYAFPRTRKEFSTLLAKKHEKIKRSSFFFLGLKIHIDEAEHADY